MISIVSPVYRAEKILPELIERLKEVLSQQKENFEIILVEDRSPDGSWDAIKKLAQQYPFVKGYRLSRNFGQHAALSAGIGLASGDKLIVMDCDLQDDPVFIPKMIDLHKAGYEIVFTCKKMRKHGLLKNILSNLWHRVFNWLSESSNISTDKNIGSYSLISRKVADAYLKMAESRRHYLLLLRWLGFSSTMLEIEHRDRFEGRSSYTYKKLLQHALAGILSQSNRLLYVSIGLGFAFVVTSLIAAVTLVVMYVVHGFLAGWASQIVMLLMCTGVILVMLGVVGAYVGMVFEQVKARPLFVIDEKTETATV